MTNHQRGTYAAAGIIAGLCALCLLFSGCAGELGERCLPDGTCKGQHLECRHLFKNALNGFPVHRCVLKGDSK